MKQSKLIASLLALFMGLAILAGCDGSSKTSSSAPAANTPAGSGSGNSTSKAPATGDTIRGVSAPGNTMKGGSDPGDTTATAVLCAVFNDPGSIERYELGFSEKVTPELLMSSLSNLTGLDFEGTVSRKSNGIYVKWGSFSTLVTGMDGRKQKEEFFMYDTESLRWFMMDSLWYTLRENFGNINVYYTQEGREQLAFDDQGPHVLFSFDSPYRGSNYYLNGNQGGER